VGGLGVNGKTSEIGSESARKADGDDV